MYACNINYKTWLCNTLIYSPTLEREKKKEILPVAYRRFTSDIILVLSCFNILADQLL